MHFIWYCLPHPLVWRILHSTPLLRMMVLCYGYKPYARHMVIWLQHVLCFYCSLSNLYTVDIQWSRTFSITIVWKSILFRLKIAIFSATLSYITIILKQQYRSKVWLKKWKPLISSNKNKKFKRNFWSMKYRWVL